MSTIEYALTVFLIVVMLALTVVAFVVVVKFYIGLYKEIRKIKKNDK